MRFDGSSHTSIHAALPFTREDYFELVEITGRQIAAGKRGFISSEIPPIVAQMGLKPERWIDHVQGFGRRYGGCVGSVLQMHDYSQNMSRHWGKGVSTSAGVYQKHAG